MGLVLTRKTERETERERVLVGISFDKITRAKQKLSKPVYHSLRSQRTKIADKRSTVTLAVE